MILSSRLVFSLVVLLMVVPEATLAQTGAASADPPMRGAEAGGSVLEVVEFSDFECPYCAMAVPVVDSLIDRHGERVRVVYRHYPLPMHRHAQRAAEAAVEAHRQGAFWTYHDLLFRNQDRLTDVDLIGYADSLRLDAEEFSAALREGRHSEIVGRDLSLGRALAVTGTPTFFVNGYRVVGAPSIWVFEEAIRAFEEGRVEPRPLKAARAQR